MTAQPLYGDYRDVLAYKKRIGQASKYPPLRIVENRFADHFAPPGEALSVEHFPDGRRVVRRASTPAPSRPRDAGSPGAAAPKGIS